MFPLFIYSLLATGVIQSLDPQTAPLARVSPGALFRQSMTGNPQRSWWWWRGSRNDSGGGSNLTVQSLVPGTMQISLHRRVWPTWHAAVLQASELWQPRLNCPVFTTRKMRLYRQPWSTAGEMPCDDQDIKILYPDDRSQSHHHMHGSATMTTVSMLWRSHCVHCNEQMCRVRCCRVRVQPL
jgi:hypothetical protein